MGWQSAMGICVPCDRGANMTAVTDSRIVVHCCGCGKKFSIPEDTASGLSILNVTCPHCGRNGALAKDCRR